MMDLLGRLKGVVQTGEGWSARCPAHDDQHNSLSIHRRNGRWLLHCHTGCSIEALIDALGIEAGALFDRKCGTEGSTIFLDKQASAQPRPRLETQRPAANRNKAGRKSSGPD